MAVFSLSRLGYGQFQNPAQRGQIKFVAIQFGAVLFRSPSYLDGQAESR